MALGRRLGVQFVARSGARRGLRSSRAGDIARTRRVSRPPSIARLERNIYFWMAPVGADIDGHYLVVRNRSDPSLRLLLVLDPCRDRIGAGSSRRYWNPNPDRDSAPGDFHDRCTAGLRPLRRILVHARWHFAALNLVPARGPATWAALVPAVTCRRREQFCDALRSVAVCAQTRPAMLECPASVHTAARCESGLETTSRPPIRFRQHRRPVAPAGFSRSQDLSLSPERV